MPASTQVFSAFSFISFILVSIPLAWHFQAQNSATCLYIVWVSLSNLTTFINSVLWNGNVVDRSPVWCDISSRLLYASYLAIPATCLRIQQRIYDVLQADPFTVDGNYREPHKKRRFMWDLLICLIFPIVYLVFVYFVQPTRYSIVENFGCHIALLRSAPSLLLSSVPRLGLGIISGVYGCLNMYRIWVNRRNVLSIFHVSTTQYSRLFLLSAVDIIITVPFNAWYFASWFPLTPYPGWTYVHAYWSTIQIYTSAQLRGHTSYIWGLEGPGWLTVAYGVLFFCFFGVGAEARRKYGFAWQQASRTFGWQTRSSLTSKNLHLTFAANNPFASDKSGSSPRLDEHIVITTAWSADQKPERESLAAPWDLTQQSSASQQHSRAYITPPFTPLDLESGDTRVKDSEGGLKATLDLGDDK